MAQLITADNESFDGQHKGLQHESAATVCVAETIRSGQMLFDRVQRICQHYGLTLSTANVLAIIEGAEVPLSPQMIRERLLVSGGAVTQFLDTLEQRGLVRRIAHPADRRSLLVEATDAGRQLRRRLQPYLQQCDELWMAGLSAEEQALLSALLRKIQQHLTTVVEPLVAPR